MGHNIKLDYWLGRQDSNLRMLESKSSALPAWLRPNFLVHLGGFEPPAHGLEVRCSIQLSYRCILNFGAGEGDRTLATGLEGQGSTTELHPHMERKTGFEPATLALARRCSTTEPLSHLGGGDWIRTSESCANGFTVRPLWPTREPLQNLELVRGLEPPTY